MDKCRISNNSSKGIYVNGNAWSSAYAHPTLSNNYIHHNSSSGITVGNYAKPLITGNQIAYNNAYGIEATSSYTGEVSYNRVANSSFQGLLFYASSHAQVHRNTVEANGSGGVYIFSNSNVTAYGSGNTKGRNEITGNSGVGLYASSSSPSFGYASNGNNWIQSNSSYEAQQVGSGYQILAENCYWGGGAPAPSEISGNVDYTPYTTTLPNPVGWGQNDAYDPSLRMWQEDSVIVAQPFANVQFALRESAVASQAKNANETSTNRTADLQAAINVGLATGDWSPASILITDLHRELQDARIPALDFALVNTYANDSKVAAFIRKMLALLLMEKDLVENKVSPALAKLAAFRQSNSANAAELLANAGLIHLHRQNGQAAASGVYFYELAAGNKVERKKMTLVR
ncbi:MAG: right-handed parallel beta-helix repeat-containing protein [candidate division KSB1 bacterium]|nr:right-handed parallel beta-helix repeat-containing protein [candidate division KSB1 bacterium]MDZ7369440.1 right-handed parallel beta-helix repeat-containing protein [candidate division KSB1 bacterium]MDZ7407525.1 right-handed parallel beta-helix repeat-containing protein [candidate division KSB1 bacterium]